MRARSSKEEWFSRTKQIETSLDELADAARTENEVDASVLFVLPPLLLLSPVPEPPPPELLLEEELVEGIMQGCCSTELPEFEEEIEFERVLETAAVCCWG